MFRDKNVKITQIQKQMFRDEIKQYPKIVLSLDGMLQDKTTPRGCVNLKQMFCNKTMWKGWVNVEMNVP